MNKFIILGLFATLAVSYAQSLDGVVLAAAPGTDPVEEALKNNEYVRLVLGSALVKAALPPHLAPQGNKVLVEADKQLTNCEKDLRTTKLVWVFKVCTTTVLKTSLNEFKKLEAQAAVPTTVRPPTTGAGSGWKTL